MGLYFAALPVAAASDLPCFHVPRMLRLKRLANHMSAPPSISDPIIPVRDQLGLTLRTRLRSRAIGPERRSLSYSVISSPSPGIASAICPSR